MQQSGQLDSRRSAGTAPRGGSPGRLMVSSIGLLVVIAVLWLGFIFLRKNNASIIANALVAIVWGVGGIAALFTLANMVVESMTQKWQGRIQPYVFVGPAIALLAEFLFFPTLRTIYISLFDASSTSFIGLRNYAAVLTDPQMIQSFRNNLLWLVFGTAFCVILGLLVAVLADRSNFETIAKVLIFMPMAISFVGAGVIWRFIYAYAPADQPQIGLINAIIVAVGGQPHSFTTEQPWNNLYLILVLVWMQTGFAMVLFSAALKGVPEDLLEAARVDGATEVQAFFRIIIPYIQGTTITVTTTIAIFTLKIFDVVRVMTGGQYGTEVVATNYYRQFFQNRNFGYGATVAIVLFIAVLPVMFYNVSQLRKQEGF
ncbi:MAG: sugar ABC transporter permease [Herpetosiphon sp.]